MCELGLADRVCVISGTNVGAINGAAFATLRGPLDLAGDLLAPATLFKDFPIIGTLAQGLGAVSQQIRIWSEALAFDGDCARRFIRQGYADGIETLRQLLPRQRPNW